MPILILLILSVVYPTLGAQPSKVYETVNIALPQVASASLNEDLPVRDLVFDADGNLWLIGKTRAWIWEIAAQGFRKISLASAPDETLQALKIGDGAVWIASDRALYRITQAPLKIFRTQAEHPEATLALALDPEGIYWLRAESLYFNSGGKQTRLQPLALPGNAAQVLYFPDSQTAWTYAGDRLLEYSLEGGAMPKTLAKFGSPVREIVADEPEHIFVHTGFSLVRLHQSGQLVQTIPVFGQRKLVLANVTGTRHGFLFHDRLLEIKDTATRATHFFRLDFGRIQKATAMRLTDSRIAFLGDGRPVAYALEVVEK